MIVEFIGCSGAGKTTLVTDLIAQQPTEGRVVRSFDLVMDRRGLRRVEDPMAVNLAADVIAFPSFVLQCDCLDGNCICTSIEVGS